MAVLLVPVGSYFYHGAFIDALFTNYARFVKFTSDSRSSNILSGYQQWLIQIRVLCSEIIDNQVDIGAYWSSG